MGTNTSTLSNKREAHALHNEKVCNTLHSAGECNDWIVTTAFYAALHFTASRLFPFRDAKGKYDSINQYFNANKEKCLSKHDAQVQLVHEKMPGIGDAYEHLYETSQNARYVDYQIEEIGAKLAREYLKKIKKFVLDIKLT